MFCLQSVEFASLVGKLLFKRRKRRLCQRAPPQPSDGGANGQRSDCNQDFSHATNPFLLPITGKIATPDYQITKVSQARRRQAVPHPGPSPGRRGG